MALRQACTGVVTTGAWKPPLGGRIGKLLVLSSCLFGSPVKGTSPGSRLSHVGFSCLLYRKGLAVV